LYSLPVLILAGIATVIILPMSVDPVRFFRPLEAMLLLLAPLGWISDILGAYWELLPAIVFLLLGIGLALLALIVTRALTKANRSLVWWFFPPMVLCMAAAAVVFSGGQVPGGGWSSFISGFWRLLVFPGALLYHGLYMTLGWVAYLLPLYFLAILVALILKHRTIGKNLISNANALASLMIVGSLALAFLVPGSTTLLSRYFLRFLPRWLGVLLFTSLFFFGMMVRFKKPITVYGKILSGKIMYFIKKVDMGSIQAGTQKRRHGSERRFSLDILDFTIPDSSKLSGPVSPQDAAALVQLDMDEKDRIDAIKCVAAELFQQLELPLTFQESLPGPASILLSYEIVSGLTLKRLRQYESEITFRLGAYQTELLLPVPGTRQAGLLFPRLHGQPLLLEHVAPSVEQHGATLPVCIGRCLDGSVLVADLATLPHLLVAGTTGSGKSVFLHSLVQGLVRGPMQSRLRLILIDPKRVEFQQYNSLSNLVCPIVEESPDVAFIMEALVAEMESRFERLARQNIKSVYEEGASSLDIPSTVVIMDEMVDLFMGPSCQEIKDKVIRLAQKARATGIHLVLATQRPSADVVDGLIKANFPARVAFMTSSQVDSRVILDHPGAERLFGKGDGLYKAPTSRHPIRFQGVWAGQ